MGDSPYSLTFAPLSRSWDFTNVGPTKSFTALVPFFFLRVAMVQFLMLEGKSLSNLSTPKDPGMS